MTEAQITKKGRVMRPYDRFGTPGGRDAFSDMPVAYR